MFLKKPNLKMQFVYFSLIFFLTWSSTLSCKIYERTCNSTVSKPCELTLKKTTILMKNAECYCTDNHFDCMKDTIKDLFGSTKPQEIYIIDASCAVYDTRELLKKLGQEKAYVVRYSHYHTRIKQETDTSIQNGVRNLDITIDGRQIEKQDFINYENVTVLRIETDFNQEKMPVDIFSNLKQVKWLTWMSSESHFVFSADYLNGINLYGLTLMFLSVPDEPPKITVNGECEKFPLDMSILTQLRKLVIRRYFRDCIHRDILKGLHRLEELTIGENELSKLPMGIFKDMINLKYLNLKSNQLEIFENDHLQTLNKLQILELSGNSLKEINWGWPLLPELITVDIGGNKLLKKVFINLESGKFQLVKQHFQYIEDMNTDGFVCDYISDCAFVHDRNNYTCPESCECYYIESSSDFVVNCTNSTLKQIPYVPIPNCGKTTLDISNNTNLDSLPTTSIYGYNEVSAINASGNSFTSLKINQIPENISYLDLSNNTYNFINDEVLSLFRERIGNGSLHLKLGGNPWACDCNSLHFVNFTKQFTQNIEDEKILHCNGDFNKSLVVEMNEVDLCPDLHSLQ